MTFPHVPPCTYRNGSAPLLRFYFSLHLGFLRFLDAVSDGGPPLTFFSISEHPDMAKLHTFKLNTGALIPSVGMGCWRGQPGLGPDKELMRSLKLAIQAGYRHLDTASMYQVCVFFATLPPYSPALLGFRTDNRVLAPRMKPTLDTSSRRAALLGPTSSSPPSSGFRCTTMSKKPLTSPSTS